jgi:DNA-directed RNA polymerase subunit RPC12/RpoP
MQQPLHTGRLVLTPEDPYLRPGKPAGILAQLHDIGFIGDRLADNDNRYLLGDSFMQLVTFMGCSPSLQLAPGEPEQPFCHLLIDGPSDHPRLLWGRNTTPPRCANCRKRLQGWQTTFEAWRQEPPGWQAACPYCGHRQDPATYDFRQSAGCGCLFLLVENIFPQEAIPSPALLNRLQATTDNRPWRYFYLQDG